MNHGWQSESTDGPKGGWSFVFWSGCNDCSGHLPPQLLDVVWCSAAAPPPQLLDVVWCSAAVVVVVVQ